MILLHPTSTRYRKVLDDCLKAMRSFLGPRITSQELQTGFADSWKARSKAAISTSVNSQITSTLEEETLMVAKSCWTTISKATCFIHKATDSSTGSLHNLWVMGSSSTRSSGPQPAFRTPIISSRFLLTASMRKNIKEVREHQAHLEDRITT